MSQGSGIPPPNKRRKSDYDANPGDNEESADFAEGGFNYPAAATDADKYRSNFYSILGRQSFPKYVAQIASALDPEAAAAASDLPPEAPFMKSANSKRDQGQAAAATTTTTQASQTALPNSNNAPQAKTLTTMGGTNNKFFGVSKTSASATTGGSAISAIASASSSSNIADASSSSSNVIGNIGLLGTWFPPPQAKWFRIDTIHDIEKQALPEFFSGKNPTKTPQIYKEYRDFMITSYRQNIKPQNTITGSSGAYHPHHSAVPIMAAAGASSSAAMGGAAGASATSIAAATAAAAANPAAGGISFTMCRRYLTGDVSAIYQVYRFLEHWGLIANHRTSFVADGAGSLPLDCPIPGADPTIIPSSTSSSLNVAAEIISSNNNNVNKNGNIVDEQQQQQTNESCSSSSSSSVLPVKAEEMVKKEVDDDDNEDNAEAQNVDYGSHHCVFIEHTAGIPDVDDANGNRWIRYEDVIGNERDIWTDQETFLLLEALKTYSTWSDVSRYVATKTPRQCLEHFLKLPINPSSSSSSSSLVEPKSTDDNENAVDTLAELIRSTPGCTDALSASDVCDDGLGTAARVGLGIARARAAELAKEEDAATEELLAEAIDAQAQKVDIKLKYLSKYERLLQGEWKALSEIKNSLLSEKVVLVSSIIKNEEAAVAAAAAAAVGMDGTVGDMVGMGIDMGAVQQEQQDQQDQQQGQNQQGQQQGQQQDQQQDQQQSQQDPSMVIGGIDADEMQAGASQFMNSPTLFSPGSF